MHEVKPIVGWKKLAVRSLFIGIGIAVTLAILAGMGLWYASRPTPPPSWNRHAIVAKEPPGFGQLLWVSNDKKTTVPLLNLIYSLENTTNKDYTLSTKSEIKFMSRALDGTLGGNIFTAAAGTPEGDQNDIDLPLFIPAKQKALLRFTLADTEMPLQGIGESDPDYHERLRAYLEKRYHVSGYVLFDDIEHYEIDLPKWASTKPPTMP
jgi:hypothetical protein